MSDEPRHERRTDAAIRADSVRSPASGTQASVFVVARSPVVRAGLERLVEQDARFRLAGSAGLVGDARTSLMSDSADDTSALVDVLILDVERADDKLDPSPGAWSDDEDDPLATERIVALVDEPEAEWTRGAIDAGVRAVVRRDATGEEILAATEAVAAGFVALPLALLRSLIDDHEGRSVTPSQAARSEAAFDQKLTPRETEVLGMLAEGLANKTIAWRLGISEHTVKFHVASVFTKLDASSRTEAVTQGLRRGLLLL